MPYLVPLPKTHTLPVKAPFKHSASTFGDLRDDNLQLIILVRDFHAIAHIVLWMNMWVRIMMRARSQSSISSLPSVSHLTFCNHGKASQPYLENYPKQYCQHPAYVTIFVHICCFAGKEDHQDADSEASGGHWSEGGGGKRPLDVASIHFQATS